MNTSQMPKYIDCEAATLALAEQGFDWDKAKQALASVPAADVVSVVRCKDCIHYDFGVCLKIYSDGNTQKDSWQSRSSNEFCSRGDRRDGDTYNEKVF